ncbi:M15 family metallopeptidase [Bowmanella sp. JS7-9]|uniref:M15 family metallopeptidase n=1 Tax=Pseudobowmanella zhangzhouensis TaxID=1537679 RepID=A0ABW1XHJ6_9ALTE|nr:M15 family metallopeptidase [Bowmanella sp. JS7-9]TBX27599.1 hypothetical protein TK45_00200 [Bowmanella sp. JS7-9]
MISSAQYLGIEESHLVGIASGHRLTPDAAAAFIQMQRAAAAEGIDIAIASSHRSFDRQSAIWQAKWQGQRAVLDIHQQAVDMQALSDEQKLFAILLYSAIPGGSRHHWGTDLDVYDARACAERGHALQLVASEYHDNGPCAAMSLWLEQHAHTYGFYRPYAEFHGAIAAEPWHLSYRPQAREISDNFDVEQLVSLLRTQCVAGKSAILAHIDDIFYRYILNKVRL